MKTVLAGFAGLLCVSLFAAEAEVRYAPGVIPLRLATEYVDKQAAPDYRRLAPYYVGQETSSDCSAASLTMALNAFHLASPAISEAQVLAKVAVAAWTAAVAQGGPGTDLRSLGAYSRKGLAAFGLDGAVETKVLEQVSEAGLNDLRAVLRANEASARDIIIANFDQGLFTADDSVGHFSPVAAYDAVNERVLVLDVDRKWVEPYWVPDRLFLKAMVKWDPAKKKHRGFLRLTLNDRENRR